MKRTNSSLLSLLQKSLNHTLIRVDEEADWDAVYTEANTQAVMALAANGLPDTLTPEQRNRWKNAEYQQLASYVRYLAAQDELCHIFREEAIPMVIVKGAAAAIYYPQPGLRAMGDIDFVVRPEDFAGAKQLMLKSGYEPHDEEDDRHVAYAKYGIVLEMHYRFSYEDLDIEEYIQEGLIKPEQGAIDGHTFPMLPRLANGLVLLAHMRRHLRVGLGLRQVIDWMQYVEHELDDVFWQESFFAAVKEKKLDTLAITATRLCQIYLGLSDRITWCAGADDALCGQLLEYLLSSGNFGKKDGTGNLVRGVMINIRQEGLFPYLQRDGERDWKLYHRHPWLKPFAWMREGSVFLCKYLEIRRRKKPVLSEMKQSRDRYEILKKLGIYE